MAEYTEIENLLYEMDNDELFDLWCEYCYSTDNPNPLHHMIDLDDEVDNYRVYCIQGYVSSYYYVYEMFDDAIARHEFDIDDAYFALEDGTLHSYNFVDDYLREHYDDIISYILDSNDCLGNVNIELALDEDEDDWKITFKTYYRN